jgi:thiol-disulfide isomerase/thioredoxin
MAKLNLKSLNLKKTFTNPKIISLIIVILVVFVGGFILNRLMGGGIIHENLDNINKPQLTYYYMEECGYCKQFTPAWDKFSKKYNNNNLKCNKVEAREKDSSVAIKGYPTVILHNPDGTKIEFNGERSENGLVSFLKENGINFE